LKGGPGKIHSPGLPSSFPPCLHKSQWHKRPTCARIERKNSMTDNELRGIILKKFYERRREGNIIPKPEDFDPPILFEDLYRICEQLGDHDLLSWRNEGSPGELSFGFGKISAYGVDVIENNEKPPIGINLTNISVVHSQGVQIGDSNVQSISNAFDQVISQIENLKVSDEEKKEAKSKLKSFLEHPLTISVLGNMAGELLRRLGG
jgi:hypothetical protein